MSLGKVLKLFILTAGICFLVYWAAASFLGPGVKDHSISLIGGYRYLDSGHYEKQIVYVDSGRNFTIVIDARVDDYLVEEGVIYVTRRPREVYKDNGVVKTRISNVCEYWEINNQSGNVRKIEPRLTLSCR